MEENRIFRNYFIILSFLDHSLSARIRFFSLYYAENKRLDTSFILIFIVYRVQISNSLMKLHNLINKGNVKLSTRGMKAIGGVGVRVRVGVGVALNNFYWLGLHEGDLHKKDILVVENTQE